MEDQTKDLNLRFVKSELEELRFQYDDAKHHGRPTDALQAQIDAREKDRIERQKTYTESQDHILALENQIKELRGSVKTAENAVAKLTTARDDLQQKLETVSLGYYPGPTTKPPFVASDWQPKIPKIQQVVLPEFDRNNFDQAIDRVDRCMSCHTGINKAGFEDVPQPYTTHPKREELLGKHPPEKFGCTPCHGGQGPAINSVEVAHGNFRDAEGRVENVEFIETPLFRGDMMQTNCIKCHQVVQELPGAEADRPRGVALRAAGMPRLPPRRGIRGPREGPGREQHRAVAAADRSQGRPSLAGAMGHESARVPSADEDAELHVRSASRRRRSRPGSWRRRRPPSDEWLAQAPAAPPAGDAAQVERGKELVGSLGCRACHALSPDEVASPLGANKDIAPNLSNIAEKTGPRWIYAWMQEPARTTRRSPGCRACVSATTRRAAITAYLAHARREAAGSRRPRRAARERRTTSRPARSSSASTAAPAVTTSPAWRTSRGSASSSRPSARRRRRSSSSATGRTCTRPGTTGRSTS